MPPGDLLTLAVAAALARAQALLAAIVPLPAAGLVGAGLAALMLIGLRAGR